jgi:hypothetical protein
MNGKPLSRIDNELDLGIHISSDLKWSRQEGEAANRGNMVLRQLRRVFKCWTKTNFKLLYSTFIRPHLEYAVAAWCPYAKKDIVILERVQRRATKLVRSIKHFKYEDRLAVLGLTTLKQRRERGDLIEYYKITNGISKLDLHNPNNCVTL